jgi:hypothetical protein
MSGGEESTSQEGSSQHSSNSTTETDPFHPAYAPNAGHTCSSSACSTSYQGSVFSNRITPIHVHRVASQIVCGSQCPPARLSVIQGRGIVMLRCLVLSSQGELSLYPKCGDFVAFAFFPFSAKNAKRAQKTETRLSSNFKSKSNSKSNYKPPVTLQYFTILMMGAR